jgi:MFS transporter, DHA1 family, multidrug resistance protein
MNRRFGRMGLLAACTSLGTFSLNLYLPSIPAVQMRFRATVAEVQATVSLALLAFGLGLVLLGPLTERHGRRPCLLGGLMLSSAGSAVATPPPSPQMLALRTGTMLVVLAFEYWRTQRGM